MSETGTVKDFYRQKNIFITGATGFLGIALIEKLLRSCDVGKIYLLMRPKKGKDVSERLEELKKNLVFEKLKEEKKDSSFEKLIAIAGDVGEYGLGLSVEDRQTLKENVHVVFHSAATLDFEAGLRSTVSINLLGTRRIVELCSEIRNIKAFVHVSSAYVNANRTSANEIIYDIPQTADEAINLVKSLPDKQLEDVTSEFLGTHPNTYTVTKALAEYEVARFADKFPCTIVRPSMIVGAWKEPVPGWTISKNGPQGFIMGAAKGVIRRLPVKKELIYDYIPVDVVVKTLIVAGWNVANSEEKGPLIFHATSSSCKPFAWNQIEKDVNDSLRIYPLKSAVWYPNLKFLPSLTLFKISAVIFHFIPAIFLDFMVLVTGGRPILLKLHTNVNRSLNLLAPFIFKEWFFDNSKTAALHQKLSEADKNDFGLDISSLDWLNLFTTLVQGVRRYLNREEPKTLPAARKKLKIFYVMNILLQLLLLGLVWYVTSVILKSKSMLSTSWILPLVYLLYNQL